MAAMTKTSTENGINNGRKPSVVILDSDEEEEQTTHELFQRFVKAMQPFLERKEVLLLRVKFAEIRPEYASSSTFRDMLRRRASQVRKTDVYIHFNEVLKDLISKAAYYGTNAIKNEQHDVRTVGESTSDSIDSSRNTSMAGKFESDQQGICHGPSTPGKSAQSTQSNGLVIDLSGESSSQDFKSPKNPTGHLSQEDREVIIRKKKRKKKIQKLERKLKNVSDEIKRLSQTDLSLEEMDFADSNYIRESRLKNQFNTIWEKICTLKGRPPDTGRVVEQGIKIKSSRFPAIDRGVQKFLKKRRGFPNIFDIRNIVIRANKKHNLRLTQSVLQEIAADVFTDIGNKLQKKRKKDFDYNFGCHLTDNCLSSLDPALNDDTLRKRLDENKKKGQSAMESVFEKYVHLGRIKDRLNDDSAASSASEYDSSDNETRARTKSKTKKRPSPYSSGDENRKVKRAKLESATTTSTCSDSKKYDVSDISFDVPSKKEFQAKPLSAGSPQSAGNGVDYESIEINDDDDDDLTTKSDQLVIASDFKDSSSVAKIPILADKSSNSPCFPKDNIESVKLTTSSSQSKIDNVEPKTVQEDCVEIVHGHANSTQSSQVSTTKQPQTSTESLLNRNSASNSKLNINTSKLLSKIQQLRDKKLISELAENKKWSTTATNGKSSCTNLNLSESVHHKRKSTIPHHIQGHVSSSTLSEPSRTVNSNVKYSQVMSNVSNVTSSVSNTSCILPKQLINGHFNDSNKDNAVNSSYIRNGFSPGNKKLTVSLTKFPVNGRSSPQRFHSVNSPVTGKISTNSVTNVSPLMNGYHQREHSLSNRITPKDLTHPDISNEVLPRKELSQSTCKAKVSSSCKADTVIILSDDED